MKYKNVIITFGFVVILVQFLGFPQSWRDALYALVGLLVIVFGYLSEKTK